MIIFESPGKHNTEAAVKIATEEAEKRGICHIVIASYTGYTAEFFKNSGLNIVIVRGTYGLNAKEPNAIRMSDEKSRELTDCGMKIVTAAHSLSGAERSFSTGFSGIYPAEVIAHTLRMFGQGMKVCVECAAMACDCGAIPSGLPVISAAGTDTGADTVIVMRAANTHRILETKICEVLCKPNL
ncbi:MAG: hypothetical protein FWG09_07565 [Synergistaceae bacterium]|nr:hypothetical protein [Synergistaceae bacterium]